MIKIRSVISAIKSKKVPVDDSKPLSTNEVLCLLTASLSHQLKLNEARLVILEAIYNPLDSAPIRSRKVADKSAVDKRLTLSAG